MAENKKSFLLYADLLHTVEKMPVEKAGELFKVILQYVNDKSPSVDDLLVAIAFEPIKQQLRRDLDRWENIKEKRSSAGRASAEARKAASKTDQNQTNSTSVKPVEQTSTNPTVNVTDNVNVNDTVTVTVNDNVIKEGYKGKNPLPFFDKDLSDKIMKYFGFSEVANFDKLREIGAFIRCLAIQEKVEYFSAQFDAYVEYKKINDSYTHSFKKFLGSHEELFIDGAWNAENWIGKLKLETEKLKKNGKTNQSNPISRSTKQSTGRQSFGTI